MRWSIRYQILVPLLLLLVGVAGMSAWAALASAGRARRQIETQVRHIVEMASHSRYPLTEQHVLDLMKGFSGADYLVLEGSGRRLTTLETAGRQLTAADTSALNLPRPAQAGEDWHSRPLGTRVKVANRPYLSSGIQLNEGRNAGSILYVFYPESLWEDAVWEAVRPPLILGGAVGLAALALALVVAQRLSRRLQGLERRTRLIAAGDFSPMPLPRRNDELRDLTRSVNEMAERLAKYQEAVQRSERLRLLGQVGGGLAHQLRNAAAGARLAVQLHARECNGAEDVEPLDVALRQLALVELHLKRFLDLGRASDLRREPCPLTTLLEETLALLGPQCRHARIALRWTPPPGAGRPTVNGDAGQLGQMFLNLVTNAMEAAGPGGSVDVSLLGPDTDRAVVEVADSGPGPRAEVAERLFEPFVTGKTEGVGLGLAVARQVAEAHGGRIDWRRDAGRTCFRVELPVEAAT